MNKLPEDFKRRWVFALRSGKYKQGTGTMYNSKLDTYCCLAVASDIYSGGATKNSYTFLPEAIAGGFDNEIAATLIDMNDMHRMSFNEIADWIEANL